MELSSKRAIVLNVDGSSMGNPGRAGFGGLIREDNGAWISGYAGFLGCSDNLQAELLAIFHGANEAWRLGFRRVSYYSDSTQAIALVKGSVPWLHKYAALVTSIQECIEQDWTFELVHTLREGNQCVDWLAKWRALQDEELHIFYRPPLGLGSLVMADAMGVPFLRV